jgi:hypothetical protein
MTSFLDRVATVARGPQGRRVVAEAKKLSRDPTTHRRIDEARRRLMHHGSGRSARA